LVWSTGIIGNLKTTSTIQRIVIEVDIRSLVEAVMWRFDHGVAEVIMNVGESLNVR